MSYLKYFLENCSNKSIPKNQEEQNVDKTRIQGLCFDMCPKEEVEMFVKRIENNLVHLLEVVGKEKKLIKKFTRSAAADLKLCDPNYLRPFPVLVKTLEYLMFDVLSRRDISHGVLYSFVDDRLRSIRQDMVVQRLPPDECRILLEPMIRFYVYSGYRLTSKDIHNCDPVLNKKFLLECLKQFLKLDANKPQGDMQEIFSNLHLSDRRLPYNYVMMESLYILCNVGDVQPLYRYLSLPKQYRCDPNLKLAYQIGVSGYLGHFVQMFRLARRLSPLGYYAFFDNLAELQRQALQVLSHAYSSKQLWVPCDVVQHYVYLHDVREVELVCAHYGLTVYDGKVNFNKADFNNTIELHCPFKHMEATYKFDRILSCKSISDIGTT